MGAYTKRDAALLKLGFGSYASYLDSDLWKSIRAKVLIRDKRRCRCCKEPAFQVHHDSYGEATLRGDAFDRLFAICEKCHKEIEFAPNGRKFTFDEVRENLARRLAECPPELARRVARKSKQGKGSKRQVRRRQQTAALIAELSAMPEQERAAKMAAIPKALRQSLRGRLAKTIIVRDRNGRRVNAPLPPEKPPELRISAKIRRTKRMHDPAALQGHRPKLSNQPTNPLARFVRKEASNA